MQVDMHDTLLGEACGNGTRDPPKRSASQTPTAPPALTESFCRHLLRVPPLLGRPGSPRPHARGRGTTYLVHGCHGIVLTVLTV